MAGGFYYDIAVFSQGFWSIVFLGFLVWLWRKYLTPALEQAKRAQNLQIEEARRHRDEAVAALDVLRADVERAHLDARAIVERMQSRAEHEREATIAQARDAGERTVRSAQGEPERARAAARERLRTELLEAALAAARSQAVARVDSTVSTRLIGDFLVTVARQASGEHG